MSAAVLKKMLLEAASALKAERFQEAADASRRVTQFDPNNYQAFMCLGLASLQLQKWDDCEEALCRAADLKPDMSAPRKYLVDLFEAKMDLESKLDSLKMLADINFRIKNWKKCQKWIAESATTALKLKRYPMAFKAWYSLVGEQSGDQCQLCLSKTSNEELPTALEIWLNLVDLLQYPDFSLTSCYDSYSMTEISRQFIATASHTDWTAQTQEIEALRMRIDAGIAFFMRCHLNELKSVEDKAGLLKFIDAFAVSVLKHFPNSKIAAEYMLLRSEDQDTPLEQEKATQIATQLSANYPRSPMALVFQANEFLQIGENNQAREKFVEALAGFSSSAFQESALCVRVQIGLASIAVDAHDVEDCLRRLSLAKQVVADKKKLIGVKGLLPTVYSKAKIHFMRAAALEYSGESDKAMEQYRIVMKCGDVMFTTKAAIAIAELLAENARLQEALDIIDSLSLAEVEDQKMSAVIHCVRGWLHFQLGDNGQAQALLEPNAPKMSSTDVAAKGKALKRLAIVYWYLGGTYRTAKTGSFGYLLQAAKLTPMDAEIFFWLGRWYQEIATDAMRAEKCFLKALSVSPSNEQAGVALSNMYDVQGMYDKNVQLWKRVTQNQQISPSWALLRLAQHLAEQDDESAVDKIHLVLRSDPKNARYWVILAHIYQHFGKRVSAQRSYLRAIELGENSWCVRCELARIEGSLLLYNNALERIKPIVAEELPDEDPSKTAAVMIYSDLLFQQAKYLCSEGLYGHAALNLKEASHMMKELPSMSSNSESVEAFKLIGDIHCFAFFLSPDNFANDGSTWAEFISTGRKAYENALQLEIKTRNEKNCCDTVIGVVAERFYDIGLSYWYEAQALSNTQGISTSAFSCGATSNVYLSIASLKAKALANFKLALQEDPLCSLAWNGLALVSDTLLVKQFAWARSIQSNPSNDATWANLGMFYLYWTDAVPLSVSLAQKSFLQLQSINPSNPCMWNGYAMLARRQDSCIMQQRKTIEAFDCTLQTGLDLDALLGVSMALLDFGNHLDETITQAPEHSNEVVLFYLKKYLERDPFCGRAWHALGVIQHRLGLYTEALASYTRAASCPLTSEEVEWNKSVAKLGQLFSNAKDTEADELSLLQEMSEQLSLLLKEPTPLKTIMQAQLLYRQTRGSEALDLLQATLMLENIQSSELEIVAAVGLSMASLLMIDYLTKESNLVRVCKKRLLYSIDQASTLAAREYENLRVIELYERWVGNDEDHLTRLRVLLQASDGANSCKLWMRLVLSSIDSKSYQVSKLLTNYLRSSVRSMPSDAYETMDRIFLDALTSIIKAGPAGAKVSCLDAQKLVRAQPWNTTAFVLALSSVLKRINVQQSQVDVFHQLLRLLQAGRILAIGKEYETAQLDLLTSYCYIRLNEPNEATAFSNKALNRVKIGKRNGDIAHSVDTDLLEARLLSISNREKAIKKYVDVITTILTTVAPSSKRYIPILFEFGGLYEQWELLDGALIVWKLVASLTATKITAGDDDVNNKSTDSSSFSDNAACFLSNLRLAIIHGKKGNLKPARRHIKAAVALAEIMADSDSSMVAAFVESVLA
ncbi:putative tetratricopeptide-like helical domain superfamily [Plasmopara halstedii]